VLILLIKDGADVADNCPPLSRANMILVTCLCGGGESIGMVLGVDESQTKSNTI